MSGQLNHRVKKGRIQGKDQEKGHIRGQSVRGSATERSASRCGKARRYQGYWMGMSMMSFQGRRWNNGYDGDSSSTVFFGTTFIGLSLPFYLGSASVHILCAPLPSKTSHADLHSDCAKRLFLEQWCQLFIPPLPSLFELSLYPLSLSNSMPLSLPSPGHEVTLAQTSADTPIPMTQEMPPPGVCVFVWGTAARALACCALSARSFRFVSWVEMWLNGNWWVCMWQY